MKHLIIFMLVAAYLFSGEPVALDKKFATSDKCAVCHAPIVKQWKGSWHAKSHFKNDEYFQKTIKFMARKIYSKDITTLQVECATCHNPRISVTNASVDDVIASLMGLNKNSKIEKAVNDSSLNEGINCAVCHNIDKIYKNRKKSVRGINLVDWMKNGKMSGPYKDAKSPYHETYNRDFMGKNSNELCFVCHANSFSESGLIFSDTQKEYLSHKRAKLCVDCHMGPKKEGIASTMKIDGKVKKRIVREHSFRGGHISKMVENSLKLSLKKVKKELLVRLDNPNPHNVPTGYGGREIVVEVQFVGKKSYPLKKISLTSHFKSKRKRKSVPHYAVKMSEDDSVPAKGKKVIKVKIPDGAVTAKVSIWYKLVNDELVKLLHLKDKRWSKKMKITNGSIELK